MFYLKFNKTLESQSYLDACPDSNQIKERYDEIKALYENNTWDITDLLRERKPIGCRWIYKIKYKSNGEFDRYRTRLVPKGYNRNYYG